MMKNKTTLTFGERTFELTFYAEHTITLHERSLCAATRAMYLSHSRYAAEGGPLRGGAR